MDHNIQAAHQINGSSARQRFLPFRNIRHVLSLHAKTSPRKPFMIHYDSEHNREELTYAEFNARAHQTANFLHDDLGVNRGDRVAVMTYNHSETVLVYFACWIIGAAVVPQNMSEDDRRIAFILRNSEAKICLVRSDYIDRAQHIIYGDDEEMGASNIQTLVTMGGKAHHQYPHYNTLVKNRPNTYLGEETTSKSDDDVIVPTSNTPTQDDEALLVYTSGTTGMPKGVVLTQYNLMVDSWAIAQAQAITGNQRMMCVLPIHHVNGIVVTLMTPLMVGGSVVLNRAFSVSVFWHRIIEERVHIVSVVPTLLQFLLEHAHEQQTGGSTIFGENVHRRGLTHFRHFICGAGTLSVVLGQVFEDTFGLAILHGYGLSETTCYSCFLPFELPWSEHQGWMQQYGYPSIGVPIAANEMAIFSADGSGQRLGTNERGEICIRGHNVMKHYFKRDDANAETFKFEWFRSGDEGFYIEDKQGRPFFFITGRIKELINRGGVKFSPFDIEEVLLAIEGVKVGLVVGFKNDYYGEEVGAYVVPKDDVQLDTDAILRHCRDYLTFEKSPKVVVIGHEIPVTSTGKYQRLKLHDQFLQWEHTQFRQSK